MHMNDRKTFEIFCYRAEFSISLPPISEVQLFPYPMPYSFEITTFGSTRSPAFPPPKGTSTQAHLYVMRAAKALTSSAQTSME